MTRDKGERKYQQTECFLKSTISPFRLLQPKVMDSYRHILLCAICTHKHKKWNFKDIEGDVLYCLNVPRKKVQRKIKREKRKDEKGNNRVQRVCVQVVSKRLTFKWWMMSIRLFRWSLKWICTRTGNSPHPRRVKWNGGSLNTHTV